MLMVGGGPGGGGSAPGGLGSGPGTGATGAGASGPGGCTVGTGAMVPGPGGGNTGTVVGGCWPATCRIGPVFCGVLLRTAATARWYVGSSGCGTSERLLWNSLPLTWPRVFNSKTPDGA